MNGHSLFRCKWPLAMNDRPFIVKPGEGGKLGGGVQVVQVGKLGKLGKLGVSV